MIDEDAEFSHHHPELQVVIILPARLTVLRLPLMDEFVQEGSKLFGNRALISRIQRNLMA